MFLDEHALNPNSTAAVKWRHWFDTFTMLSKDKDRNNNLDKLIKFILCSGEIKQTELKALKKFDTNIVFNKVQECIKEVDESHREILYRIIGEAVVEHASDWVRSLWNNPMDINLKYRSYLTAKCLPTAEGLERVIYYVESQFNNSVKDHIAKEHLCHFRNYRVIDWMKGYISKGTTNDNWYSLFACSEPTWKQVKEWLENGGKFRMVAINALEYMIRSWNSNPAYIQGNYKITNPPSKDEVLLVLEKVKSEEILNSKKKVYDMIIDHIDYLLI